MLISFVCNISKNFLDKWRKYRNNSFENIRIKRKGNLRKDSLDDRTGPDVFLKFFLAFSDVMSIKRSSWGVEYFLSGANFLRIAGFRGGLDRIKSKMRSWASFFTFNGSWPSSVLTLFSLYLKYERNGCKQWKIGEN